MLMLRFSVSFLTFSISVAGANAGFLDDVVDFVESPAKAVVDIIKDVPAVVNPLPTVIDVVTGKQSPEAAIRDVMNETGQLVQDGTSIVQTVDLAATQTFEKASQAIGGDVGRIVYEVYAGPNRYLKELAFTGTNAVGAVLQGQDPLIALTLPLAAAIRDARNQFIGISRPLPPRVVTALSPIVPSDVLSRARIAVGRVSMSLPSAIDFTGGFFGKEADAVTLDDVIVFFKEPDFDELSDLVLLAHELYHVYQYQTWGLETFAFRYAKNYSLVEGEAEQAEMHATQYFNLPVGGPSIQIGGSVLSQVQTAPVQVSTPLGSTSVNRPVQSGDRVLPSPTKFTAPVLNMGLTDRCIVNGERVVIAANGQILSLYRNGQMVGQRSPPMDPFNCLFDMSSQMGRFCVQHQTGLVFFGAPLPVGQCGPCQGEQCLY